MESVLCIGLAMIATVLIHWAVTLGVTRGHIVLANLSISTLKLNLALNIGPRPISNHDPTIYPMWADG